MEMTKNAIIANLRRTVLASMETGNTGKASTVILELAELDLAAAQALRADVVASYGMDI